MTYHQYLELEPLLQLQKPRSEDHDEMLFILIHQVYELWFKQILHELDFVMPLFAEGEASEVLATLKRVRSILKVIVTQVDVLETMTPLGFAGFRNKLETASGFQSFQFREFEAVLGLKNRKSLNLYDEFPALRAQLKKRMDSPTIFDGFLKLMSKSHVVPQEVLDRDVSEQYEGSTALQEILIEVFKSDFTLKLIMESLIDIDEGLQEWRYRHVKMVERTIGVQIGTGGSAGVEYLKSTVFKAAFPDLWKIRDRF